MDEPLTAAANRALAERVSANRLVHEDDPLDRARAALADRVVQLRRLVPTASVVDAVAVTAEHIAGIAVVEVLTSDAGDLRASAAHVEARLDIVAL